MRAVAFLGVTTLAAFAAAGAVTAQEKPEAIRRIDAAATVFSEVMRAPDEAIPSYILDRAECVVIIPGSKRAGFVVGGSYGKGVTTCRAADNLGWTGPSTVRMEGGSFGAQIGAGESDIVLVVMNPRGVDRLLENQFTIGVDAAAMAGPVGRQAEAKTDAYLTAQMLTYARSRGLFAGATLNGATLRPDNDDNKLIYGKPVDHRAILEGKVRPPEAARPLYVALNRFTPEPTVVSQAMRQRAANLRAAGVTPAPAPAAGAARVSPAPETGEAARMAQPQDMVQFRDGQTVRGTVLSANSQLVRVRTEDGTIRRYPVRDLASITFGGQSR